MFIADGRVKPLYGIVRCHWSTSAKRNMCLPTNKQTNFRSHAQLATLT